MRVVQVDCGIHKVEVEGKLDWPCAAVAGDILQGTLPVLRSASCPQLSCPLVVLDRSDRNIVLQDCIRHSAHLHLKTLCTPAHKSQSYETAIISVI